MIAVLNWNRAEETIRALESSMATTYSNVSFLLVDNGSSQQVVDKLRIWADSTMPSWRLITDFGSQPPANRQLSIAFQPVNLGYAGGNNIALQNALSWNCDWVLILNNDAVLPAEYVTELVSIGTRQPNTALIGSRQSFPQEYKMSPSWGIRLSYNLGAFGFWRYGPATGLRKVNFAPGNSVLVRTDLLRQVGLFDERYFLYTEDVDLSYRAMKAGWDIMLNLDVVAEQGISTSLGGRRSATYYYYVTRNSLLFLSERLPRSTRWVSIGVFVTVTLIRSIGWLMAGQWRKAQAAMLGLWHFLAKHYGQAPPIRNR
jgi:GT2 family glycosyltransferase